MTCIVHAVHPQVAKWLQQYHEPVASSGLNGVLSLEWEGLGHLCHKRSLALWMGMGVETRAGFDQPRSERTQ